MQNSIRQQLASNHWLPWLIVPAIIALAAVLGLRANTRWLTLLLVASGAVLLLWRPALGLLAIVAAALLVTREFDTGSAVKLNAATLLIVATLGIWLLHMVRTGKISLAKSRTTLPLLLFVGFGLLSLLIGNVTWDPNIARSSNFTLVQLAQWAIFALAAGAYLLTANLIKTEAGLRTLTWSYLGLAGTLAILFTAQATTGFAGLLISITLIRAPFWVLLFSLAGGILLFDRQISAGRRLFLVVTVAAVMYYAFAMQFGSSSTWVSVVTAAAVLVWLRWPRLRWPAAIVIGLLIASNVLFPALYDFAGGDDEWFRTGGSRVALIERVVEVTMRNPVTGLGPASYRLYANAQPLRYEHITWFNPRVSAHNNYVDLFAHVGIIGMALFAWFVYEAGRLSLQLHRRYKDGFRGAYVNGMLAAGVASLLLMTFADWILPFVYNIGFPGFQASVLVWLFLGGLVALDTMSREDAKN